MSESRWLDDPQRTFERMVGPKLASLESARLDALAAFRHRLMTGGPVALAVLAAIAYLTWNTDSAISIILIAAVFLCIGVAIWANGPKSKFEKQVRDTVMGAVCEQIGDMNYRHEVSQSDFPLEPYRNASIVPSHSYSDVEDLVDGTYRGCRFAVTEARLRTGGKNKKTVFKGLLLKISLPRPVSTQVTIVRDQSAWGSLGRSLIDWFRPGERVDIPHTAFEEKYDVYSKDPSTALEVITRDFVTNFLALPNVLGSDKILAAFSEDMFLVSVADTPAFLNDFKASKPVGDYRDLFEHIVEETQVIHRVIDQLLEGDRYAQRA